MARAYDLDDPAGHERRVRLPRAAPTGTRSSVGPVHGHAVPGRPPGRGVRRCGSRPDGRRRWPTPATPTPATALVPLARAPTCCSPRRPSSTAATTAAACTSPAPRGARGRRRRAVPAAGAHPPAAVERPRGRAVPQAAAVCDRAGRARRAPARRTSCEAWTGRAVVAPPNAWAHDSPRRPRRRPAPRRPDHPRLARPRRGLGARRVRPHPGAVRGVVHRGRAALAQGQRRRAG